MMHYVDQVMSTVDIPVGEEQSIAVPRSSIGRSDPRALLCLVLVLGVAGLLDSIVAFKASRTVDEPDYISYGVQVLKTTPDRSGNLLWNSKTPASALNALPRVIAESLEPYPSLSRLAKVLRSVWMARLPSILSLLLLNWLVYWWVYELYGITAALACSVMVVLSPNLIAHGVLATADGYFALGVVASLYFFRRYLLDPTVRNAGISAVVLALAQLAKPFAFYLYGVVFVISIVQFIRVPAKESKLTLKGLVIYGILLAAAFVAVINVGYSFRGTLARLGKYHFESASFQRIQSWPLASALRVPLPRAYLQGLDLMKYCDDSGLTYGNLYLLGDLQRLRDPGFHKFKSYYLVAWLIKEPIALQVCFALGLFSLRKRTWNELILGEGPLLLAAGTLVVWQSLFRNSQIGIRNILPALAVEIIIAGAAFASFPQLARKMRIGLLLLLGWLAVSTLSYYPQMIPYMNEWVIDRKMSYKFLADSNIDWNQNQRLVDEFLSRNPDVKLNPEKPTTGRVLVSVNHLVGIYPQQPAMTWLLQSRPVAHVGYAHLLYVVPNH